jgi:hypothetical protein
MEMPDICGNTRGNALLEFFFRASPYISWALPKGSPVPEGMDINWAFPVCFLVASSLYLLREIIEGATEKF